MQEKSFSSQLNLGVVKKFPGRKDPREQKQIRVVLEIIFVTVIVLILAAIGYREIPKFWSKFSQPGVKFEKQKAAVELLLEPLRGKYGIYFEDLEIKESFGINAKETYTAASLIKMPVMLTLYREAEAGRINLEEIYKLQATDKRPGAGALQYKSVGYEISFRKMAELMGKQSDNTAFNVISQNLSAEKIQATINALGMKTTSYADNLTSPEDMGIFFRKLYSERVVSDKSRDEILSFITDTIWEERIPVGVPKGIKVSHKIGTELGVISDAGIVFAPKPFILVIMTEEANEIEAKKALPEITKKIYESTQQTL